ncbi:hypothetical protein CYLTODRAFT_419611 [Cylindrobasidium torrendii FP15055 ss-10]|uniref:F-box domain-containing protein n=1 Tax=Cylindrobasidium torrendii FP15055 ss-10 TaxID=1314674 RepID=A0A0D7BK97_9AGAR|nr:hypothetical protein CYLTODRAFT_419611 [Cylindrobasidium torrendii FP15055 ss-10]
MVTLPMLKRRPDVARHVRKLIVHPRRQGTFEFKFEDSATVSSAIRNLAASGNLEALTTFAWDDAELPYYDDMWFALRVRCPQLKFVKTSLGAYLPHSDAHVFDFSNLRGFSVALTRSFYEFRTDGFFGSDSHHPLSMKLWKMLIERCPDLEELAIDGSSPFPVDMHMILEGNWPRLQKLYLGDVVLDWGMGAHHAVKNPFIDFLERHPALQNIKFSRHNVLPQHLASLDSPDMKLTSFSGTLSQLASLPPIHYLTLTSVAFTESMHTRDVTAVTVGSVLQSMPNLRSLKISFHLHSIYDSGNLLRSLVTSCPYLTHLQLTCTQQPSFQLETFAKAIKGFTKLRTLDLAIVRYPGDDSLAMGAERIALTNPRLRAFSLTFLPFSHPFHQPLSFPLLLFNIRSSARGNFRLMCDEHGLPHCLRAYERRRVVWPWIFGHSTRTRQYTVDLRPSGFPGKAQGGMLGFMTLLTESSSAGEEMRMFLFCLLLLSLAIWGYAASKRITGEEEIILPLSVYQRVGLA